MLMETLCFCDCWLRARPPVIRASRQTSLLRMMDHYKIITNFARIKREQLQPSALLHSGLFHTKAHRHKRERERAEKKPSTLHIYVHIKTHNREKERREECKYKIICEKKPGERKKLWVHPRLAHTMRIIIFSPPIHPFSRTWKLKRHEPRDAAAAAA